MVEETPVWLAEKYQLNANPVFHIFTLDTKFQFIVIVEYHQLDSPASYNPFRLTVSVLYHVENTYFIFQIFWRVQSANWPSRGSTAMLSVPGTYRRV